MHRIFCADGTIDGKRPLCMMWDYSADELVVHLCDAEESVQRAETADPNIMQGLSRDGRVSALIFKNASTSVCNV